MRMVRHIATPQSYVAALGRPGEKRLRLKGRLIETDFHRLMFAMEGA